MGGCKEAKTEVKEVQGVPAAPCVMVIFGASGDLTKRKLIPSLYNLSKKGLLPKEFAIVGIARRALSTEEFRKMLGQDLEEHATIPVDPGFKDWFKVRIHYLSGDAEDQATYSKLKELLSHADKEHGTQGNYFYYLATAPKLFAEVVKQLGDSGLARERGKGWRRIIIEKPFGRDLDSARQLNHKIRESVEEHQIYRIDHYLGKETVQNIMVFRFANGIMEPIWNRRYVDHVQITVAETLGVEQRGGYYDKAGALRDMVPNHIFQLITLTAMEPPISFGADAVRDEQAKILRAIRPMTEEEVLKNTVRGQYGQGNGMPGYREEDHVPTESQTETYVAMKLGMDNWRWAGVPFFLRTGKRLPRRVTEIAIQFKRAPFTLFQKTPVDHLSPNQLVLRIQPDEGISLSFDAKVPGPIVQLGTVDMDFKYKDYFGATPSTGYERLLYDCMMGDATLFQRADMVEAGWQVVQPVLDVWSALPPRAFPNYAAGTWGPSESCDMIEGEGRAWRECES